MQNPWPVFSQPPSQRMFGEKLDIQRLFQASFIHPKPNMPLNRLRDAIPSKSVPVKNFKNTGIIGSVVGLVRKLSYPQRSPIHHPHWFKVPPFGTILLALAYLCFILGLEYTNQNVPGEQHNQAIGVRAGWLTITQIPLLILLSGKVNLIGLLSGVSYERLNVLHRWVARTMLLTATLHMGYQQALWNKLGLLQLEWSIDTCPPTGLCRSSSALREILTT